MLLQLLEALGSDKLSFVVQHMSMAPIDINLHLYEGQHKGEIEVVKEKNRITALKKPDAPYYNSELADKIVRLIREYDRQEANITLTRLQQDVLDIMGQLYLPNGQIQRPGQFGYPTHEFICTLYALEQGQVPGYSIKKYEIEVPAVKNKRPYSKFVFYTELDHQEYGARDVRNYIAQFDNKKVK